MDAVLLKIAIRNLRQHMTKTLIVGVLITLGIIILVVGYSFMDTIKAGIEKNYIENYTGNIFIAPNSLKEPNLIVSPESFQTGPKTLENFNEVRSYIESLPEVTGTTGQLNGVSSITWGELGEGFAILFGVDSSSYQALFPHGIKLIEGDFLSPNEEGIVLSRTVAEILRESAGQEIHPGDKILLSSINTVSGTKIREVTVRGIHDYGDAAFDLSFICFIDETNLRIMNGMILNKAEDLDLTSAETESLGALDETDLFGTDDPTGLISEVSLSDTGIFGSTEEDIFNVLGDISSRAFLSETDTNAWNFLLVKIDDNKRAKTMVKQLNTYFEKNGIEVTAYDWLEGAGMSAKLADTISIVFNILIFIVAVVAVIIIMNTLVISVSERYGEIGTMRAIGARKMFIRKMISLETLMITLVFGFMGVLLGILILLIIRGIGIQSTNQFLQILLGGDVFRPIISVPAIFTSVGMVSLVGILASLYPVAVALKISPLEAMNKG